MGPGLVGLCGKSTCYLLGASPVPYVPPRRWLPAHQAPRNPALHPPLHHQQLPQLPQPAGSLPLAGWWQPQKIWLARTRACGSRVHHHLPDSPASSASRERTRLCVNNLMQFFAAASQARSFAASAGASRGAPFPSLSLSPYNPLPFPSQFPPCSNPLPSTTQYNLVPYMEHPGTYYVRIRGGQKRTGRGW